MRVRLAVLGLAAMAGAGCTFGFGSPYVGQWRAREAVEFEVCVEDQHGACTEEKPVVTRLPARKFWGFSLTYPMVGMSFPNIGGEGETALRLEMSAEYLRGKGRFAWGLRQSAIFDVASENTIITAPLTLISHVGLSERFSAYGGLGFSWYNNVSTGQDGMIISESTSYFGGRALAGLQIVGSKSQRNSRIFYTFEVDSSLSRLYDMTYRSWGMTLSIGLFL